MPSPQNTEYTPQHVVSRCPAGQGGRANTYRCHIQMYAVAVKPLREHVMTTTGVKVQENQRREFESVHTYTHALPSSRLLSRWEPQLAAGSFIPSPFHHSKQCLLRSHKTESTGKGGGCLPAMRLPIVARSVAASVARHPTHGTIQGPGSCAFPPSQPAPYMPDRPDGPDMYHARFGFPTRRLRASNPFGAALGRIQRLPDSGFRSRECLKTAASKTPPLRRRDKDKGTAKRATTPSRRYPRPRTYPSDSSWYSPPPKTQHQPASPPPPPLASTQ